jgi:hypothetical protein
VVLVVRLDRLEQLADLPDARAAVGARLAGLSDLLQRAGAATGLVEDRSARNTLAQAHDHGGLFGGTGPRAGRLKVILKSANQI